MPWLLLACCLAIFGFCTRAHADNQQMPVAPVVHFEQAWRAEVPLNVPAVRGAFLTPGLRVQLPLASSMSPPQDSAIDRWRLSALPDALPQDLAASVEQDRAVSMIWYRVRYPGWGTQGRPQNIALYIPRCPGGALHVYARTPQGWYLLLDNRSEWASQWNRPQWVSIPSALLGPDGAVEVALGVPHAQGAPHGLTRLWMGPPQGIHDLWAWRWALQITAPQVISLTILVLGIFSFFTWLRRPQEPTYWMFALISVSWCLRNLHLWLDVPTDVQAQAWFWWLAVVTVPWFIAVPFVFAYRFQPRRYPLAEQALLVYAGLRTVLTLPLLAWPTDTIVISYACDVVVGLVAAVWITRQALRDGSRELIGITLSFWTGVILGAHDLGMITQRVSMESVLLLPLTAICFTSAFLYALHRRYLDALAHAQAANTHLAWRLADQAQALAHNHQRLLDVEKKQGLLLERQRLMRDMHDGVGSALITSLAMVERGQLSPHEVADVLRECVDDLRAVIESLEPMGQDLNTLLGTLRHRLEKRLTTAGLRIVWSMDDLPSLTWLEPTEALQILRMAQEILTNVLKHAQARTLSVSTRLSRDADNDEGACIELCIADDGQGFDVEAAQGGRGLRHLKERARRLGGVLSIESSVGQGCTVRLTLPVTSKA
jgi:signal transduction histidine kinase